MNWNLIKNEIRRRHRGILAWAFLLGLYSILMIGFTDPLLSQSDGLKALLEGLGDELLSAVNVTSESFTTFEGFYLSEYGTIGLIASGIFAAYLGASTFGKEIKDGSIKLVVSRPIKRIEIFYSKVFSLTFLISVGNVFLAISSILAANLLVHDFTFENIFFIKTYIAFWVYSIFFLAVGILAGILWDNSNALLVGIALNLAGIILNIIETIDGVPEFIKFLNPFDYASIPQIIAKENLSLMTFAMLLISILIILIAERIFYRKEIV